MHNNSTGRPNWLPPSPEAMQMEIASQLGALHNGQRLMHDAIKVIFRKIDCIETRLATLEAQARLPSPSPQPTVLTLMATLLADKEIRVLIGVILAGLIGVFFPEWMPATN